MRAQAQKSEFAEADAEHPLNALWNLTSLVSLSLDGNNLQELPPQICNLTNLERLSAAGCGLAIIPMHLVALARMRQLLMSANPVNRLPRNIGNSWTHLIELDFDDTNISDLPASIGRCTNLTRLRMNNCPLIWPLDKLSMQGPSCVLQFLADRESADVHAPSKQLQKAVEKDVKVSNPISQYTVSGLSRYYKDQLHKTDQHFREKFDLVEKSKHREKFDK